ncbi:MAG: RNA polymerase sigma factor [Bacteriovoracaceae bacterium]|nr:RNA polymerase sigma factor [Bacteriovoracaceae bacterium]
MSKILLTLKRLTFLETPFSPEERLAFFEKIYKEHHLYIRKTLYWLMNSSDIDEVMQDTFMKIWRKIDSFREESQIKTWIYRIAINTAYDHLRKNKKYQGNHTADLTQIPDKEVNTAMQDLIRQGIAQLPVNQQSCFVLFYKAELTLEEISKTLHQPVGTVKSQLHYARESFKQFLSKQGVHYE